MIETILDKKLLSLKKLSKFLGKKVIITVREVPEGNPALPRTWDHLGDLHLDQPIDAINLRDFAYD